MRLSLRVAFLSRQPRGYIQGQTKCKIISATARKANAPPNHSQQPSNETPRTEWELFQALIREIHRSEEHHRAAERKFGAAQLRTAKGLNRITAVGAIVGTISSLGIIGSLVIAKIAADDAHMALVCVNRAWIGPVKAALGAIPRDLLTEDITIPLPFRNTGHEPATDASIIGGSDTFRSTLPMTKFTPKNSLLKITASPSPPQNRWHLLNPLWFSPKGDANNDYNGSITIRSDLINWDVVYGRKYVFVHACVIYQTFGEVRHTSVCYYAQAGKTIGSLPFCDKG